MPVPSAPHILGRDPPIHQHKSEYMPAPPKLAYSQGYATFDDWARGPISGYVLRSLADRADPSIGPIVGDDADDCNTGCFSNDDVRDDDFPQANHVLLYHDVAPTQVCFSHFSCILQTLSLGGPNLYILDCLLVGLDYMYYVTFWQALDIYVLYYLIVDPNV